MPDVPRYNTNAYREFKQECLQFLVSTQVYVDISKCGCATCIDGVAIDSKSIVAQFA